MPTTVNAAAITNGDLIPLMDDAGGGSYTQGRNNAQDIRAGLINLVTAANGGSQTRRTGVVPATFSGGVWTDLRVVGQGSPSTTITVKAGQAIVPRTGEGNYLLTLTQDLNIVMNAANGSNPRWDRICLMGYDKATFGADAVHGPYVVIVYGDAAGSPTLPSIPTDAIEIARTLRAAGAPGDQIGSGSTPITLLRKSTSLHGGARILLEGDSLSDIGGYHGEVRVRAGTQFINNAYVTAGYPILEDRWDAVNTTWRGTQEIKLPKPTISTTASLGGNATFTLAFASIWDPGWPYRLDMSGSILQSITGGANTAVYGVYLQFNIDDTGFGASAPNLIRRTIGPKVDSPKVIELAARRSTVMTGDHTLYFIIRNESNPSNFITWADNEYAHFSVSIVPA